jgi:hypothetical protein
LAKAFGGLGVTAGLAADRTSMTSVVAGQQFFETDTNKVYMYNGTSWVIVNWLGSWPSFWVKKTASTSTVGTIVFDSVVEQVGGSNYSTSTGLFTAPVAGIYEFSAQSIANNTTGWGFWYNGGLFSGPTPYQTYTNWTSLSATINKNMAVGDTMGVYLRSGIFYGDGGWVHNNFTGTLIKPM